MFTIIKINGINFNNLNITSENFNEYINKINANLKPQDVAITDCTFENVNISNLRLKYTYITSCKFINVNFGDILLYDSSLKNNEFENCTINKVWMQNNGVLLYNTFKNCNFNVFRLDIISKKYNSFYDCYFSDLKYLTKENKNFIYYEIVNDAFHNCTFNFEQILEIAKEEELNFVYKSNGKKSLSEKFVLQKYHQEEKFKDKYISNLSNMSYETKIYYILSLYMFYFNFNCELLLDDFETKSSSFRYHPSFSVTECTYDNIFTLGDKVLLIDMIKPILLESEDILLSWNNPQCLFKLPDKVPNLLEDKYWTTPFIKKLNK